MVSFSKLQGKIKLSIYENLIENFVFLGKKSILFDQLLEFYELKYKSHFSQNDGQISKKSIKKYIRIQSHILDFSKLQDKIKILTTFKMTKILSLF